MNESNPWIIEANAKTFENDVIRRSHEVPVIVEFWAPWCEPCKTLGPLIEKRAVEGNGRFLLVKVDIDKNPELAQALRVQGIPALLALVKGQMADGAQGALPEDELDAFLDRVAAPLVDANATALASAREAAEAGDRDGAIAFLREHLAIATEHDAARVLLTELLLDGEDVEGARAVFDELAQDTQASADGKALAARIDFAESDVDFDELRRAVDSAPESATARIALGKALVAAKDYSSGLEELLEAVRLDSNGSEAKAAMLGTFEVLGLEDPIANEFRFKLSLELFA